MTVGNEFGPVWKHLCIFICASVSNAPHSAGSVETGTSTTAEQKTCYCSKYYHPLPIAIIIPWCLHLITFSLLNFQFYRKDMRLIRLPTHQSWWSQFPQKSASCARKDEIFTGGNAGRLPGPLGDANERSEVGWRLGKFFGCTTPKIT